MFQDGLVFTKKETCKKLLLSKQRSRKKGVAGLDKKVEGLEGEGPQKGGAMTATATLVLKLEVDFNALGS